METKYLTEKTMNYDVTFGVILSTVPLVNVSKNVRPWSHRSPLALCILLFSILTQIPFFFNLRVRKNSIMYQSNVPQKPNVSGKLKATCPYVITFGMKIGNVQNAAKGIAAIIM